MAIRRVFFHGTGARRRQSIGEKGIVPRGESYVHATSNPDVAAIFATARADQEGDWGLVISFVAGEGWEVDPRFPDSYMRKEPVPPEDILTYTHIQVSDEFRKKVKKYGIELHDGGN